MRKAMVLAAGFGTRLRPLTESLPKPLVRVAGIPLIDRALDWLYASGVKEAVVNTHYKAEMLEAHLAARKQPAIRLSHEDTILETGGGIKKALPLLGDAAFFAVNGDVICLDGTEPALHRLARAWDDRHMDALLLIHPVAQAIGYHGPGDFFMDGNVLRRRVAQETAPFVFTGIQLLHPRIFAQSPSGAFSLNVLYNRAMKDNGSLARVSALAHDGQWLHIGDQQGLAEAEAFFGKL